MSGQSESPARKPSSGLLLEHDQNQADHHDLLLHGAQSYYLSQSLNAPRNWKSCSKKTKLLRKMQSRNWLLIGFDNIVFVLKSLLFALGDKAQQLLAGVVSPGQARIISIYATTLLLAIVMLVLCREINLYCFRTVVHNENGMTIFPNAISHHVSSADDEQEELLSQSHSTL